MIFMIRFGDELKVLIIESGRCIQFVTEKMDKMFRTFKIK